MNTTYTDSLMIFIIMIFVIRIDWQLRKKK